MSDSEPLNPDNPYTPPVAQPMHLPPLVPSSDQVPVLYVIGVYTVVIFGLWNVPGARNLIYPLKLFVIGWHELCHAVIAVLSGGYIERMCIDPILGGCTIVNGGHPPTILVAGYLGSTFMGAAFVLAGFDTLVAKVMSFVAGIGILAPLVLVRDKLTILLIFVYEGLLIGFWFIDHGQALRWYMLFLGIMHIFYCVWDIADDKYFRKPHDSDATQYTLLFPSVPTHFWAILWILFEIGVLIGFILIGIAAFKETPSEMATRAATFLPT